MHLQDDCDQQEISVTTGVIAFSNSNLYIVDLAILPSPTSVPSTFLAEFYVRMMYLDIGPYFSLDLLKHNMNVRSSFLFATYH